MINLPNDIPKQYNNFKYRYHWFYSDNFLTVRYNSEDGKDKAVIPYILADGQWQNKAPKVPCPLYNQQEIKDEPKDQSAFVCEGEKNAAALRSLRLLATTSLGGANSALKSDWSCLSEFETVYIISDNDEAGKKYVNDVALKLLSLENKPKAIYYVDLPDLSESEDVVDWIKKEIPEWDEYAPIPSDRVEDIKNKLLKVIEENRQPISELWGPIKNMEETNGSDIPAILLPEPLNRFATALANQFEVSEGVVVLAILGITSSAINKKFDIIPREAWNEPINTYAFIALPPANNKSAILRNVMKPIILWEKQQREILEPKIRKQVASNKLVEEKIKSIRKKIAEAENILNEFSLQQRLTELEESLIEPDIIPQIFINDTTPEALANTIHQQGNKGAVISDEGGVMESLSGMYSGNRSNVDIILKGIDGGDVRVRRKDRNYDLNPYLTILMIVQPQILINMQDKDSFKGNGFLERFLYLIPKSNLGYRSLNTQSTPKELIDQYNQFIFDLLNLEVNDEAIKLYLSAEAQCEFDGFRHYIERELRPDGSLYDYREWGGKICGYSLRIAGQLHMAEYLQSRSTIIDYDAMMNAIEIAKILISHAQIAYGLMGIDQNIIDANSVLEWINNQNIKCFDKSSVTTKFKNRKAFKGKKIDKILSILIEQGYLKHYKDPTTKKPTDMYVVNPKIYL